MRRAKRILLAVLAARLGASLRLGGGGARGAGRPPSQGGRQAAVSAVPALERTAASCRGCGPYAEPVHAPPLVRGSRRRPLGLARLRPLSSSRSGSCSCSSRSSASRPWDVLNQGVSEHTSLSFGTANVVIARHRARARLGARRPHRPRHRRERRPDRPLCRRPARDRRGRRPVGVAARRPDRAMVAGILIIGIGSGFYIGAGMGAGPRDSLMLVAARRTGVRIGVTRAAIEVAVTVVGFALGGTVGIGTLAFAFGIGPAVELSFWLLERSPLADRSAQRCRTRRDPRLASRHEGTGLRGRGGDAARRADARHEQAPAAGRELADGLLPAAAAPARRDSRGARRHGQGACRADDRPARRRASHRPRRRCAAARARPHLQGADPPRRDRRGGRAWPRTSRPASRSWSFSATTSSSTRTRPRSPPGARAAAAPRSSSRTCPTPRTSVSSSTTRRAPSIDLAEKAGVVDLRYPAPPTNDAVVGPLLLPAGRLRRDREPRAVESRRARDHRRQPGLRASAARCRSFRCAAGGRTRASTGSISPRSAARSTRRAPTSERRGDRADPAAPVRGRARLVLRAATREPPAEAHRADERVALAARRHPRASTSTSAARTTSSRACRERPASSCSTAPPAPPSPRTSATRTPWRSTSRAATRTASRRSPTCCSSTT